MKKELAIHLFCFILFFLLLTLLKRFFTPPAIIFWLGGLVGTFLPDIDHLIYVYFLQPHELTSQRAQSTLANGNVSGTVNLLVATREERTNLIFHSGWFQLFFLVVTFWVLSSSLNPFGRGVVLAFSLHLLIDQFMDLSHKQTIDHWFVQMKMSLTREKSLFYCLFILAVLIFFGVVLG